MKKQYLDDCNTVISFIPIKNEPDVQVVHAVLQEPVFTVPPDKDTDPFLFAEDLKKKITDTEGVYILVPGQAFDADGTRHGRGGGWYDRLLSALPQYWQRIGVCTKDCFSETPLERQSWDEPVDYIAIVTDNEIEFIKTNSRS